MRCFQLRHLVPAVLDFGKDDLAALIGVINAEIVQLSAVGVVAGIPDLELRALDGIAGHAVHLADLQRRLECIEKGYGRCFAGLECHFLRDGAENDMAGNIDLRHLIGANGNRIKEYTSMAVGGGRGGVAAVDLLDAVGHALNGFPIGDVLLDDLKARFFIVHKSDFTRLSGAQRHSLLCIAHDIRLRNGLFPHHIDGNGRERRGTICSGSNGRGEVARDRLNGKYCAGNGLATHGIALDDLHIRQRVVLGSHGVLLIAIGRVHIDADGRRVCTVPRGRFDFDKGPEALGNVLYLDNTAVFGHIAADNLTVTVDQEAGTIQSARCSCGDLL